MLSMSIVGVVFVCLGLALSVFFSMNRRTWLPVALFVCHAAFAAFYCYYTLGYGGDAYSYYTTVYVEFGPGTDFVRWLTANARDALDATYLDLFMLFHIAGFVALVWFHDLCRDICHQSAALRRGSTALVFMPGLHFWTGAIGKDALAFLGIVTFIRATRREAPLSIGLGIGFLLCAMVRPHMAMLLAVSWGIALIVGARVSVMARAITLLMLATVGMTGVPWVAQYVGLDGVSADAMAEYVEKRQGLNLDGGSSVEIGDYPFPLQFLTLMFRPLFFDAEGLLGLVVSAENAIYVFLALWSAPNLRLALKAAPAPAFMRMNLIFWFSAVSVLGATLANLGLAIRQKTMVLPSFLILTLAALAVRRSSQRSTASYASGQPLVGRPLRPNVLPGRLSR